MELATFLAFSFLVVGFVVGWCLRELYLRQKDYTQLGLISVALSAWAASETRGLKSAPILRQYIERYLPSDKLSEAEVQQKMGDMAKEFEAMFSGNKPKAKEITKNGSHPEDLV